ncbi:MAG: methyltransferase domain-containing protein [Minisyncoccia bacterium]|jgi:ubiquinone/menaquinone biosynthesis C-methylase UbiE
MTNKDTSWGGVADWYDGLVGSSADSFQSKVIMPNLLRVLEPRPGMTVLDVACGQGHFTRAFAQNGAKAVGCDISPELIALAKKNSPPSLEFKVAPADKLSFAADKSFDAVTIVLALQNIENLAGTLSECARVLKPGSRLILVLNHPAFRIPKDSSWGWDEKTNVQYRRIDSYMSDSQIKIDMTPGESVHSKKKFTVSFHRPLQSYFKALNKAGFSVTRLEEWISHKQSQKGPRAAAEDRARKEIPMFLMLEAVKS